jgi:hypothetical protein
MVLVRMANKGFIWKSMKVEGRKREQGLGDKD